MIFVLIVLCAFNFIGVLLLFVFFPEKLDEILANAERPLGDEAAQADSRAATVKQRPTNRHIVNDELKVLTHSRTHRWVLHCSVRLERAVVFVHCLLMSM